MAPPLSDDDDDTKAQAALHQPDPSLLEPFHYINSVPGKDVRGRLIDCFQFWFKVDDPATLDAIKDIVGDLHNASLLIDDIEDNVRSMRSRFAKPTGVPGIAD